MKFSSFTTDGLNAVLWMALRYGEGSIAVSQIAKKENRPPACLGQILNRLKKKGLVKSVRGPQGGYVLSKKPSDITLYELFSALDDKQKTKTLLQVSTEITESTLAQKLFWEIFEESLKNNLSSMTLKDLVDKTRSVKKSAQKGVNFQI